MRAIDADKFKAFCLGVVSNPTPDCRPRDVTGALWALKYIDMQPTVNCNTGNTANTEDA